MSTRIPQNLTYTFEKLCARILEANGIVDESDTLAYRDPDPPDFIGREQETGKIVVAESKLYLSTRIRLDLFYDAISRLLRKKERYSDAKLLLITSIPLAEADSRRARGAGINEVWDLPILYQKASVSPSLQAELDETLQKLGVGDRGTSGAAAVLETEVEPLMRSVRAEQGARISAKLKAVADGAAGWREFEDRCQEALLFLFEDEFGSWAEQTTSSDGLHRRDFIVRLRPRHDFWISLSHDFRSRYVVFEFKNHVNPISQAQIYSTEKYLYTTALRSIAIVVARNGADDGAYKAATGALREAGKLIVIVSMDNLLEMLRVRDRGEDAEVVLYKLIDDVLTGLAR